MEHSNPQVDAAFRSPIVLRWLTCGALLLWMMITGWVLAITIRDRTWLEARVYLGLGFFDSLFLITALHHQMHRVIVDAHGMTITGLLQMSSTHWRDIIKHERGFGLHFWTRDGDGFALSPLDTERFDDLVAVFTRQRMIPQEHVKKNTAFTCDEKPSHRRHGKHRRHRKNQ